MESQSNFLHLEQKKQALDKIRQTILDCKKCNLCKTRTNVVPGEGNPEAEVLFVGEAPGANEDQKGIPFCGAAGKFLDQMLNEIGLSREKVFITNTLKCRPPENRDPEEEEKSVCRPYLEEQFKIINPKIIVCLGRHSMATFLPLVKSITVAHGKAYQKPNGQIYLPLYHPAAALHNGGLRVALINDFKKIPIIINKIKQLEKSKDDSKRKETEQLKLV